MSSKRLIEQFVSGKSAKHLIDSLVEELPPLPVIRSSIQRTMPKDTVVRIDDNVLYLQTNRQDKPRVYEQLRYFELAYPELQFVVE